MAPPVIKPPFTLETAKAKVQAAEDAWNTRDAEEFATLFTSDGNSIGFDGPPPRRARTSRPRCATSSRIIPPRRTLPRCARRVRSEHA